MSTDVTQTRFLQQSVSLPRGLVDWLREEADRQEHGNISRIVQEAIKQYRDELEIRRQIAARELERIA